MIFFPSHRRRYRWAAYILMGCLAMIVAVVSFAPIAQELTAATVKAISNKFPYYPLTVTAPINSDFGIRNGRPHNGVDIAIESGTPIVAVAGGTTFGVGDRGDGYGNAVEIKHNPQMSTLYAHMSRIAIGDNVTVRAGQIIGYVGSTGNSTGPHLHFEVRSPAGADNFLDPKPYLNFQVATNNNMNNQPMDDIPLCSARPLWGKCRGKLASNNTITAPVKRPKPINKPTSKPTNKPNEIVINRAKPNANPNEGTTDNIPLCSERPLWGKCRKQ